jgi:glycine/D-amino acid oxidase-like deaminating enzyme
MYDVPGGSCATGVYSGQPRRRKLIATDATEGSRAVMAVMTRNQTAAARGVPVWAEEGEAAPRRAALHRRRDRRRRVHCALLHPGRLVRGLAARVESLGGVIYEDTAVTGLGAGRVRTDRGTVTAPVVVRATEAFTPQLAAYRRQVVPPYSMALATAPLPGALREELGLASRIAFNDLRIYAHPTADGRLVFGGRGAPYHFGSAVSPRHDADDAIHGRILGTLRAFFPRLDGVDITHRWGGPLGVPRDWFPSAGYDPASGVAWAGPYVGDGVATSNLAGRILRNLITGREDELSRLPVVNHRSPRWEAEPLRWLAVNAGLRAAATADLEERLTRRPSTVSALLERLTGAH